MTLACAAYSAIFGTADVRAAEIRKCVGPHGGIAYQTAPCEAGEREVALLRMSSSERDGTVALPVDPPAENLFKRTAPSGQWLPFERRPITPGMTDDEVLNSPSGGVPARIARGRDGRAWREVWTYVRRGEVRELEFVNGRLASIGDATATYDAVRLAARRE